MKFAVVEVGGKQYVVEPQQKIKVEKLSAFEKGGEIKLEKVLLWGDGDKISVGQPTVAGAEIKAEILGNKRDKKIIVFRYRPKARVRVKRGHRQHFSELLIKDIKFG